MKRWLSVLLCTLLMACAADDYIYRKYPCFFVFDTSLHRLPCQLTAALSSTGQFVKVETFVEQGVRQLKTTRNYDNHVEFIRLSTEGESRRSYALGANNCIIVGMSSYDNMLIAYEGQCSNCLENFGGRRYPLTWQNNGSYLHCDKCNRTYNVNNGVVAEGTAGIGLFRYRVGFDGAFLSVSN